MFYSFTICLLVGFHQTTCNNNLKQCLQEQSFLAGKAQCFVDYGKCLINKGPVTEALMDVSYDGEPDRHPYVVSTIKTSAPESYPRTMFLSWTLGGVGGRGEGCHSSTPLHMQLSPKESKWKKWKKKTYIHGLKESEPVYFSHNLVQEIGSCLVSIMRQQKAKIMSHNFKCPPLWISNIWFYYPFHLNLIEFCFNS